MSETPHSMIHQLRNQIRTLDENIFRLYLVDREFDTFARPILHWFINRPEIISVIDATDILVTSFIKKYGGAPDFWEGYITVSHEELLSVRPENTQMTAPEVSGSVPAAAAHTARQPVSEVAATAYAEPHARNEPAPDIAVLGSDNTHQASSEAPAPAAEEEPVTTDTETRNTSTEAERPTSPLQATTSGKTRVRAKAPVSALTTPQITAPAVNLVGVSAAADHHAELTETPVAAAPVAPTPPERPAPAQPAEQRPTAEASTPASSGPAEKPRAARSETVAAKPKKALADEDKAPTFVPEPMRERLFDEIRITLDSMMKKYRLTQFKDLAERVTEAAKPHEGLSVPVSILYALHSNKYFRKYNRTYVTSQNTALNILRLLRHMKNPKSGHLRATDDEIMAEFRNTGRLPGMDTPGASLVASN